jgi:hypothetical protein
MADQDERLRHTLVTFYHENRSRIDRGEESIEDLIDRILGQKEVVYAVWLDAKEPRGIGYLVIKGQDLLADRNYIRVRQPDVLPCESEDKANRLKLMFEARLQAP